MSDSPVSARTPLWEGFNQAADAREFRLQVCAQCARVQYPPREVCRNCLSDELNWSGVDSSGTVQEAIAVHASLEPWFRERTPWWIGKIVLDCGVKLIAHLDEDCRDAGAPVQVMLARDCSGSSVFVALASQTSAPSAPELIELLQLPAGAE